MDGGRLHAQFATSVVKRDEVGKNTAKPSDDGADKKDRMNVDEPLWDQDSYVGRWKHFAFITDFRTIFFSEKRLCEAKKLCEDYKAGREPEGTTREDVIWAKKLRDSSFHPDNGELMNRMGRMSFQLPGSLLLTAGMLAYYKTTKAVIGWQIFNQSFSALVNYTNRNARNEKPADEAVVRETFLVATTAGCAAALMFRRLISCRGNLMERWSPFVAVASSNAVNLPIIRQREMINGIDVTPKENNEEPIMKSKIAAMKGIAECVESRIAMAAPGMLLVPVIVTYLKPFCFYQSRTWLNLPMHAALCGIFLSFMIPTALAIYPQRNSMPIERMKLCRSEYERYEKLTNLKPEMVYYNKGL